MYVPGRNPATHIILTNVTGMYWDVITSALRSSIIVRMF